MAMFGTFECKEFCFKDGNLESKTIISNAEGHSYKISKDI